jgi:hypothetical protein
MFTSKQADIHVGVLREAFNNGEKIEKTEATSFPKDQRERFYITFITTTTANGFLSAEEISKFYYGYQYGLKVDENKKR